MLDDDDAPMDDNTDLGNGAAGGAPDSLASNGFSFPNPGAVFDSMDDAAAHALGIINPVSKDQNKEYAWLFYRDPHTGQIGYTDPVMNGFRGKENFPLTFPRGMTVLGMAHTHGDYADANGNRVSSESADALQSDGFSQKQHYNDDPMDMEDMRADRMDPQKAVWSYYLGTPSGRFLKYTQGKGMEDFPGS